MEEELRARGWGRCGWGLSTVGGNLTCNEYRGFALCALGPECVLALVLGAHIGEDELMHCTLLHDLHTWQVRDLGGEGWA